MYCPKCGKETIPGAMYCSACGAKIPDNVQDRTYCGAENEETSSGNYLDPPPTIYRSPDGNVLPPGTPYKPILKNNPYCVAALALAVASLIFVFGPVFGAILGVAGIILAKLGMDQVDENPGIFTGRNMGQVGLILGIVGVSLNVMFTVFRIIVWGFDIFW